MMAEYSVCETASDLLLEPEDLKEVYELFFADVRGWLHDVPQLAAGEREVLAGLLHSLKGSANNLRMEELAQKARLLEKDVLTGLLAADLIGRLAELELDIGELEAQIKAFYLQG